MTGKSPRQVRRYADPGAPDQISAADVLKLERAARNMLVTGFMAHAQGAVLLRLPAEPQHRRIHARFARIGETVAALFGTYGDISGNGVRLDAATAGRLIADIDAALSALSELRAEAARV